MPSPPNVAIVLYGFLRFGVEDGYDMNTMLRKNLPSYIKDMYVYTMSDQHEKGYSDTNKKITEDVIKQYYSGFNLKTHIWDYDENRFKALVPPEYKTRCDLPGSGRIYRMYSQIYHMCEALKFAIRHENPSNPYDFVILTRGDTYLYRFSDSVFRTRDSVPHQPLITPIVNFPNMQEANDHFVVIPRRFVEARASCFENITTYLQDFFLPNNILPWCEACYAYHDYVKGIPKTLTKEYDACIKHDTLKFVKCKKLYDENEATLLEAGTAV